MHLVCGKHECGWGWDSWKQTRPRIVLVTGYFKHWWSLRKQQIPKLMTIFFQSFPSLLKLLAPLFNYNHLFMYLFVYIERLQFLLRKYMLTFKCRNHYLQWRKTQLHGIESSPNIITLMPSQKDIGVIYPSQKDIGGDIYIIHIKCLLKITNIQL